MGNVPGLWIDRIDTPIGEMLIVSDHEENLVATDWTEYEERTRAWLRRQYGESGSRLEPACEPNGLTRAIRSYFAGELKAIDKLPANAPGRPFSARCGARCARFLVAPRSRTENSLNESGGQVRCGLSV